ncbi:hypothetical protein ERJ75_000035000 [Trypanosoma vivax]|uniref:RNA-editing substrate-binding complex 6 protein domain-containing protein n=1 Tax=Trypanosoma vivax (strain Y486) TaxID=1055687 RepID=G0U7T2_TRYVY|nr:hypothetical protein TRVL_00815 [Trypanosoma vivax]KAH8620464.1 hypothetical protein ERJ75_000035000 [Trypanosoma vivax]CCC51940.1 conserved hypothetical protein [Trypanosoma vivax Y486]
MIRLALMLKRPGLLGFHCAVLSKGRCMGTTMRSQAPICMLSTASGASPVLTGMRFYAEKPARVLAAELTRARGNYLRSPTKAQQEDCLRIITGTPLHRVHGLDGKVVSQCLSTFVVLNAPSDLPMLHDCAVWLSVHPDAFPPHSLAQSLYALVCLEYNDISSVVSATQQQLQKTVGEMATSSLCMLLATVLTSFVPLATGQAAPSTLASTDTGEGVSVSRGPVDLTQHLSERVLRAIEEGVGLTEKTMIAIALGKILGQPAGLVAVEGVISDHVIQQLSASVWAAVPAGEMSVVSLTDLVGLLSVVHTSPESIRDAATSVLLEELNTRVEAEPITSPRGAVQLARVLRPLSNDGINSATSSSETRKALLEKVMKTLTTYIDKGNVNLTTSTRLLAEFAAVGDGVAKLPPSLVRRIVRAINEGREKWDTESVRVVLRVFSKDSALRADAVALAALRVEFIKNKDASGIMVDAGDVAALLVEGIIDPHADVLASVTTNNIARWSVSQVLTFLRAAAEVNGKPTRAIMRDVASKLVSCMEKATAGQVSAVMSCYGRARVRNDVFCAAVTSRAALLASDLTLQQISVILGGLAAVEYRDTKLFIDLAPVVISQASIADPAQTASLLASFAKMLVWNFKVFWSLAERALAIHERLTLPQIFAVLMSLTRMDLRHDNLVQALLKKVMHHFSENPNLPLIDIVLILGAFSRAGVRDPVFFQQLGKRVVQLQHEVTPEQLAETLMAFARAGLAQLNIFEELTLRTLAIVPTCPLMALASITVAYANVGYKHEELFSIVADRFISQKLDVPAVTIASVLSAFATIGIRHDRLFIESIPRVRHVGQYGTPKDIVNVVYAYAHVGLWHYKLFVRLAERAVLLRGEFRCDHLTQLLDSYARVDMRYEKLFVEFSPRVQTVAHLLTAGEMAKIVSAYVKVRVMDDAVFKACMDRSMTILDSFERDEAVSLLNALRKTKVDHNSLETAFTKRFPDLGVSLVQEQGDEESTAAVRPGDTEVAEEEGGQGDLPAETPLESAAAGATEDKSALI